MVKAIKLADWFGHGLGVGCRSWPYREQARPHKGFTVNTNPLWERACPR